MSTQFFPPVNRTRVLLAAVAISAFMSNVFAGDLTVNANSSSGGSLTGAVYKVFKGPNYVGQFAAGTTQSLTTGHTYTVFAIYDNTSTSRYTFVSDAAGNTFNFKTTLVTFHFSGGYLNFGNPNGGWTSFGKTSGVWNSRELFPKDYYGNVLYINTGYVWNDVRGYTFQPDFEGKTTFEKTISILSVKDHNGNPIAGVSFRGGVGSNYSSYFVSGTTNSNGLLLDLQNGNNTHSYEAKVNNTTADDGPQNSNTDAYFLFKTIELTLRLQKCDGSPLSGGTARYGYNSTFSSWYFPAPNSTNGSGVSTAEFFPGTYSFEMNYQTTAETKISVTVPNANTTLTWTTTKLTLDWPYDIAYGGSGDSRYFNKPSMELLPGTVNFNFRGVGNNYAAIAISGCSMHLKPVVVRLLNSSGAGVAGGGVDYYVSSWATSGATGSNGNRLILLPGTVNNAYFRMNWANASQQLGSYNINSSKVITFQTKNVTVELRNGAGNLYNNEGTNVGYYASNWNTFGSGTTSGGKCNMELLPVNYYFRMTYLNQQQQKGSINIATLGANPTITFNTVTVTLRLNDAAGTGTHEATALGYYTNNWYTFGTGVTNGSGEASIELLPGNYYFRMTYANQSQQKGSMNITGNTTVGFNTVLVTLDLKDYNGNSGVLEGNSLGYYTNTWHTFGSGNTSGGSESMELLPGNYYFRMAYSNMSQQKGSMYINANTTVPFQTVLVTQTLKDNSNNPISGAAAGYYSNTWHNFGTTDANGEVSKELLPGNYYFNMTYNSYTKQKGSYNVNGALTVPYTYTGSGITRVASNSTDPIMEKMAGADAKVDGTANTRGLEGAAAQTASTAKVNVVSQFTAYPNPFNTVANINYTLSSSQNVRMEVYNAKGINVKTLVNGNMPAGSHTAQFEAANLSEGVYYVRLFTDKGTSQVPVILTK